MKSAEEIKKEEEELARQKIQQQQLELTCSTMAGKLIVGMVKEQQAKVTSLSSLLKLVVLRIKDKTIAYLDATAAAAAAAATAEKQESVASGSTSATAASTTATTSSQSPVVAPPTPTLKPEIQFAASLQTQLLSWVGSVAATMEEQRKRTEKHMREERLRSETERKRGHSGSGADATDDDALEFGLFTGAVTPASRMYNAAVGALGSYFELVLDSCLEIFKHVPPFGQDSGSPDIDSKDKPMCGVLGSSVPGVLLASLSLAVSLLPAHVMAPLTRRCWRKIVEVFVLQDNTLLTPLFRVQNEILRASEAEDEKGFSKEEEVLLKVQAETKKFKENEAKIDAEHQAEKEAEKKAIADAKVKVEKERLKLPKKARKKKPPKESFGQRKEREREEKKKLEKAEQLAKERAELKEARAEGHRLAKEKFALEQQSLALARMQRARQRKIRFQSPFFSWLIKTNECLGHLASRLIELELKTASLQDIDQAESLGQPLVPSMLTLTRQLSLSTPEGQLEKGARESVHAWLKSDLLKIGLGDSDLDITVSDTDNETDCEEDENDEELLPPPLTLSRRLTPRTRKEMITASDLVQFGENLINNTGVASKLVEYLNIKHGKTGL